MASQQKALILTEPKGNLIVGLVDIPEPGPGEVLVEIHATALNPVDWIRPAMNMFINEYPAILGSDAAGIVKKLGEGVVNVAAGDRITYAGAMDNRHATFQQYGIAFADTVAKIPSNMSFEEASTVPLTMNTAALGLYGKKHKPYGGLELSPPWEEAGRGKYAGQPILITGGSSSVGQFVIQFAKMSGFSPIITTASKRNETYLKSLGATHVIDRVTQPADLPKLVKEITSEPVKVVYDAVPTAETQSVVYTDILASGGKVMLFLPLQMDKSKLTDDKEVAHVFGSPRLPEQREIGLSLYRKVPELLAAGELKPNQVELLRGGLGSVPEGLERLKGNTVSAGKLVVIRPLERNEDRAR